MGFVACRPPPLAPVGPLAGAREEDAGTAASTPEADFDAGAGAGALDGGDGGLFPCDSLVQCIYLDDAGGQYEGPCFSCPSNQICEYYKTRAYGSGVYAGSCRMAPAGCALDDICDCLPYFTPSPLPVGGPAFLDGGSLSELVCYQCVETLPYGDAGPPTVYCALQID